jgi:hypothetical protein
MIVIVYIIIRQISLNFNKEYQETKAQRDLYKKLYELMANEYCNLAEQVYDIERDNANHITYCKVKKPFEGYIKDYTEDWKP